MARPPKNAEGPSATERMESAFWDCMGEMPFSEITVRDIVGRAKVNRNSYYYHYDSMWDLAQAAIEHAKFAALARVLLGDSPASDEYDTDVAASQAKVGFDHLRMLAGENGNQRLLEDAKRAVVNEWLGLFGLDAATLPNELRSSIDFVFGGVTALLAADRSGGLDAFESTVADSDLLSTSIGMLRGELDPQGDAGEVWTQVSQVKVKEEHVIIEHVVDGRVVDEQEEELPTGEVASPQVNEVLAPHEEPNRIEDGDDYEPVIETVVSSAQVGNDEFESAVTLDEEDHAPRLEEYVQEPVDNYAEHVAIEIDNAATNMQEPADKESAESLVERVIEEEMHSESLREMNRDAEFESTQVPEQETQTQQETENEYEDLSQQEPVNEPQSQEDLAPEKDLDDVSAHETEQEGQPVVNTEQEPVNSHEPEANPPWETADVSATEVDYEERVEGVAIYEAAHAELSELEHGSADDALDEQAPVDEPADDESDAAQDTPAAGSEVAGESSDEDDGDSQLSFDFLF